MSTPQVQLINPPSLPRVPGYSQVATVTGGDLVFIAGQVSLDASGAIVGAGDFAAQATQTFQNLMTALAAVGASATNLIKLTSFVTDMSQLATFRAVRDQFLDPAHLPASTLVQVSRLFREEFLIEVEAIAVR
jgi:enamine deaminase RidA (YjgF/YER057c/UK114 family)